MDWLYSLDQDKITSLFDTLMIPTLNPLIYSLQNKDVKIIWIADVSLYENSPFFDKLA